MNEERTGKNLRQVEHIRGHLSSPTHRIPQQGVLRSCNEINNTGCLSINKYDKIFMLLKSTT